MKALPKFPNRIEPIHFDLARVTSIRVQENAEGLNVSKTARQSLVKTAEPLPNGLCCFGWLLVVGQG
jgi:hypothetical protein